jgi:signal transduction histidine kinase
MKRIEAGEFALSPAELATRLHDAAAGLAVAIAMTRCAAAGTDEAGDQPVLMVMESALADLRDLMADVAIGVLGRTAAAPVVDSVRREASVLGIQLTLRLLGREEALSSDSARLLRLAGREALRNVRRHSKVDRCQISLEIRGGAYEFKATDSGEGSGVGPGAGVRLLEALAREVGADLCFRSDPTGTEMVVRGRIGT